MRDVFFERQKAFEEHTAAGLFAEHIDYKQFLMDYFGIDLDTHIKWKMKYNELRPYKHGGKKY